jgi:alkyl hydroperoxide reductase subunit AhpF
LLSLIAGARSATIDDQNDGHTVDVLVGQLKVEVEELVLELDTVVEVEVTVGAVLKSKSVVSRDPNLSRVRVRSHSWRYWCLKTR